MTYYIFTKWAIYRSYLTEAIPSQAMAFAKPNIYHEHFLAALAHYAGRKMHQFEAREVSNALWSFTILRKNIVSPQWSLGEVWQNLRKFGVSCTFKCTVLGNVGVHPPNNIQ